MTHRVGIHAIEPQPRTIAAPTALPPTDAATHDTAAARFASGAGHDYRADIDGLRALAVTFVVLFHAKVPGFTGGFVGVDVFFVISGYLITLQLLASGEQSLRRRLKNFYLRRARRILPALLACLVVYALVAAVLLLPDQLAAFGHRLSYAAVLLGNVGARLGGGYFAGAMGFAPLRHLWSIAVEEQFYLAYPLALLVAGRWLPRHRMAFVAALALFSLVMCVWASYFHPAINYYMLPTRAWELLTGGLLVFLRQRVANRSAHHEPMLALALTALFCTAHLYDPAMRYPGLYTLVPVIATAILIAVNPAQPTFVHRLLSLRPLVFTGLISYSIYLWHAPIIDSVKYYSINPPSGIGLIATCAVLYGLSVLSWSWIEKPFRQRTVLRSDARFCTVSAIASIALACIGLWLFRSEGLPQRFDKDVLRLVHMEPARMDDVKKCTSASFEAIARGELCHFGPQDEHAKKIVVWGDSHALMLLPAFKALADTRHLNLYFSMRPSCRPLQNVIVTHQSIWQNEQCVRYNLAMLDAVKVLQPDGIILNAFWLNPDLDFEFTHAQRKGAATFDAALTETLTVLKAPHRAICIVLDVPTYPYPVPYALAMSLHRNLSSDPLRMTRTAAFAQQRVIENAARSQTTGARVVIVDPRQSLCDGEFCALTDESGTPLYFDGNHLSSSGADRVAPVLEGCIADADRSD